MMRYPEFTLHHMLLNSAERAPSHVAVVNGTRSYTYRDLVTQSARLALELQEHGVRPGDRVGVFLEKRWEAVVAMFGVSAAGAVFVNINPLLRTAQVQHIIQDCRIDVLIAESEKLVPDVVRGIRAVFYLGAPVPRGAGSLAGFSLSRVLAEVGSNEGAKTNLPIESDLCTIIYTSGSTGRPKGIMLTHHNVVAGAQIVSTYLGNSYDDRVLAALPFSFDYGLNQLTTMVRVGGSLVLQRSLLPGDILRSLHQNRITGLAGVPPFWSLLLQARQSIEREPLTLLRYITNSGGTVPGPHLDALRILLPRTKIYLMYGLTEAFRSTFLPPAQIHRGSACIGKAIPNTQVWVVDESGRECAPEEVGELVHRGPTVALGYWGDEERTNSVYRPNPFAPRQMRGFDKVVYSGDLVKRDHEGFLYFVGRRDELIKTQGYRVGPIEIEELLCSIPAVREAAVFGVPDETWGSSVTAVVSFKAGVSLTADQLRRACAERAPSYMVPREVVILAELPKTPTGKIDRSSLKSEYAVAKSGAVAEAARR